MQTINNTNNIQERLQILHDYIQRTIDALNDLSTTTRQIAQGLPIQGRTDIGVIGGLGHSPIGSNLAQGFTVGYQAVPTQYGMIHVPIVSPVITPWTQGIGGFQHSPITTGPIGAPQIGVPQIGVPQIVQTAIGPVPITVPIAAQPGTIGGFSHTSRVVGGINGPVVF